jgi:hypothetical protein
MGEQHEFYDKIVAMHKTLREQPKEFDPRWSSTPLDPIPASIFPFFHEEPDQKHHQGVSRIQMLMSGTYMGQELKVPEADRRDGICDEEAYVESVFDLSHDIANRLECAAHFFQVHCCICYYCCFYCCSCCFVAADVVDVVVVVAVDVDVVADDNVAFINVVVVDVALASAAASGIAAATDAHVVVVVVFVVADAFRVCGLIISGSLLARRTCNFVDREQVLGL